MTENKGSLLVCGYWPYGGSLLTRANIAAASVLYEEVPQTIYLMVGNVLWPLEPVAKRMERGLISLGVPEEDIKTYPSDSRELLRGLRSGGFPWLVDRVKKGALDSIEEGRLFDVLAPSDTKRTVLANGAQIPYWRDDIVPREFKNPQAVSFLGTQEVLARPPHRWEGLLQELEASAEQLWFSNQQEAFAKGMASNPGFYRIVDSTTRTLPFKGELQLAYYFGYILAHHLPFSRSTRVSISR